MRADGGEAWKLTDAKEGAGAYSWAPDSTRIAYVDDRCAIADDEANIKKRDDERVFEGRLPLPAHLGDRRRRRPPPA